MTSQRRSVWGWMMFDWASQPYATLLLTFIFAPYFATVVGDSVRAQEVWGYTLSITGLTMAALAPILGALADGMGRRMPWIAGFSALYMLGSAGLWWAYPQSDALWPILLSFGLGLLGMEFATIFTNAMLPDLGPRREIGRISGNGWALGYAGGVVALVIMLLFFAENEAGKTLLGRAPVLGLDPVAREGTRAVGPFTALWFAIFMVPFFLWVREKPSVATDRLYVRDSLRSLVRTLRTLPSDSSLSAYLASSMFYRDALAGIYTFGGIYAVGVLGWSVVQVGIFGIIAAITGAIFAWVGGYADRAFGPRPVLILCIVVLIMVAIIVVTISPMSVMGITVPEGSKLPDKAFIVCGAAIGAAGGALGAASRTMMVHQANPARMTEAFGLYALAGKATSFLAPFSIALVTGITGSQRAGILPLIFLFLMGLVLLVFVKTDRGASSP